VLLADVVLAALPGWVPPILNVVLILVSLFLILLVLIQRGKGGGLAGAFGGAGGSSAFGSRAGDTFTRITVVVAAVWILLIMITVKVVHPVEDVKAGGASRITQPEEGGGAPAPEDNTPE
jgi:preprotein translocase subunit SecG